MTDTITPELTADEYRTTAKVLRTHGGRELGRRAAVVQWCEQEAARLEAESARDEEDRDFARHWWRMYVDGYCTIRPERRDRFCPWDEIEPSAIRVGHLTAARSLRETAEWLIAEAVHQELTHLAADGRLLPEGGTVLEREYDDHRDADGNRWTTTPGAECPMRSGECVMCVPASAGGAFDTLADRIREQAATAARPSQAAELESLADEVERLRRGAQTIGDSLARWQDAAVAATNSRALIDADGDGEWDVVFERLAALGDGVTPPAVSVPDSGPDGTPEKPWPTWQDVPEGVRVRTLGGFVKADFAKRDGRVVHYDRPSDTECCVGDFVASEMVAPFARVDGDKA